MIGQEKNLFDSLDLKDWLVIVGFLGQALYFTWRSGWQARAFGEEMRREIGLYREESVRLINSYRDECRGLIESERRIVGEGLLALRGKISEVELYGVKEFVRRDSFHGRMNDLQEAVSRGDHVVQEQIRRLEDKVDGVVARLVQRGKA